MNVLTDLFSDLSTFTEYAQGVETSNSLDDLQASGRTAKKRVEGIISQPVYTAIVNGEDDSL